MDETRPERLRVELARCRPWLEAELTSDGLWRWEQVEAGVAAGSLQLWAGERSALITEMLDYPEARTIHAWVAGGDLGEIVDRLRPAAEAYGRARGCKLSTIDGRKGWARVLAPHDYFTRSITLMKAL